MAANWNEILNYCASKNLRCPTILSIFFNLGSVLCELKRPKEALPALKRSLERSRKKDSIVRKLFALIAQCHRQLDQTEEALQVLAQGRSDYPDDPEMLFLESNILRHAAGTTEWRKSDCSV